MNVQATLDHTSLIIREQDVPLSAPNIVLSEEDFGRLAAGYVCLNCLEDLDTPFPDACPICGYGMREHQTRELNQHFEGYIALGPSTTLEEEAEMMAYLRRKEEHDTGKRVAHLVPFRGEALSLGLERGSLLLERHDLVRRGALVVARGAEGLVDLRDARLLRLDAPGQLLQARLETLPLLRAPLRPR